MLASSPLALLVSRRCPVSLLPPPRPTPPIRPYRAAFVVFPCLLAPPHCCRLRRHAQDPVHPATGMMRLPKYYIPLEDSEKQGNSIRVISLITGEMPGDVTTSPATAAVPPPPLASSSHHHHPSTSARSALSHAVVGASAGVIAVTFVCMAGPS